MIKLIDVAKDEGKDEWKVRKASNQRTEIMEKRNVSNRVVIWE